MRTESCFREVNCFSVDLSELYAIFIVSEMFTLISFHKMTVVDLTQFLIVQIFDEEVDHFVILLGQNFDWLIFFDFRFSERVVNQVNLCCLFGDQFSIPTNKEVISVKIRTANLSSYRDVSFFGENNTVDKMSKLIFFTSILKSTSRIKFRDTDHFSDISRMKTRISSDDNFSLDMFFSGFEIKIVKDGTIKFSFFENIVLVNNLNKRISTPMILADFSIIILLFILS